MRSNEILSEVYENATNPFEKVSKTKEAVPALYPWEFGDLRVYSEEMIILFQIPHYEREVYVPNKELVKPGKHPLPTPLDTSIAKANNAVVDITTVVATAIATPLLKTDEHFDFSDEQKDHATALTEKAIDVLHAILMSCTTLPAKKIVILLTEMASKLYNFCLQNSNNKSFQYNRKG